MARKTAPIPRRKRIALIAHDDRKEDLLEWADFNRDLLNRHTLFGTGTTGTMIREKLDLNITPLLSGPLGGDQQIGARIAEGEIDMLIFFWDPLASHPHDPDVRALLRLAVLQNIPVAVNRSSADFILSSVLVNEDYERMTYDFAGRLARIRTAEELREQKEG